MGENSIGIVLLTFFSGQTVVYQDFESLNILGLETISLKCVVVLLLFLICVFHTHLVIVIAELDRVMLSKTRSMCKVCNLFMYL